VGVGAPCLSQHLFAPLGVQSLRPESSAGSLGVAGGASGARPSQRQLLWRYWTCFGRFGLVYPVSARRTKFEKGGGGGSTIRTDFTIASRESRSRLARLRTPGDPLDGGGRTAPRGGKLFLALCVGGKLLRSDIIRSVARAELGGELGTELELQRAGRGGCGRSWSCWRNVRSSPFNSNRSQIGFEFAKSVGS
jgi:hypothetical protein